MATVRIVTGARLGIAIVLTTALLACAGDDADTDTAPTTTERSTTSTSPPRPTTTTSTIYAPGTVEAEVEAAYLRSWEVYSEAVYTLVLDEEALASVVGDPLLAHQREEIGERIASGRAALVRVEHNYEIELLRSDAALVTDTYVNHQVLIDPTGKGPIEPDPNEVMTDVFALSKMGGRWLVTDHRRV